jgi:hypothetical protein
MCAAGRYSIIDGAKYWALMGIVERSINRLEDIGSSP